MKKQIQSFLNIFGGKNQIVSSNGKNNMSRCNLEQAIQKNKTYKEDVYFIINPSTGMKDSDVKELACNYVDLDAGKDSRGNYLTDAKVRQFKRKALKKIKEFSVAPTYIVETRNGYHVYWNYKTFVPANYLNRKQWKIIQNKIFGFFATVGSDKQVQKVNQLMRVPHLYWYKTWSGKNKSFLVKVAKSTRKQSCYKFENLIQAFSQVKSPTQSTTSSKSWSYKPKSDWNGKNDLILPAATLSTSNSYNRRNDWNGGNTNKKQSTNLTNDLENDIIGFLNDLSQVLYSKNLKYFASQCKDMAQKIQYK